MPGELHIRQPHAADRDPVGSHFSRSFEAYAPHRRNEIVLIDAVATYAYRADEPSVLVERHAARKDLNPIRYVRRLQCRSGPSYRPCEQVAHVASQEVQLQAVVEGTEVLNRN